MLCIDLAGPSTVITGNRAQKSEAPTTPDATAEPDGAVEEEAAPETA